MCDLMTFIIFEKFFAIISSIFPSILFLFSSGFLLTCSQITDSYLSCGKSVSGFISDIMFFLLFYLILTFSLSLYSNFQYIHAYLQPVSLDPIHVVGISLSWAVPLLGQSMCLFSLCVKGYLGLWATWLLVDLALCWVQEKL